MQWKQVVAENTKVHATHHPDPVYISREIRMQDFFFQRVWTVGFHRITKRAPALVHTDTETKWMNGATRRRSTTTTYVSSPSRAERIGERPWLGLVAYLPPPQPAGRRVNAGMRLHEEAERVRELGPVNTLGNRNKLGGKAAPSVDKSVCMGANFVHVPRTTPTHRTAYRGVGVFSVVRWI